MEKSMGKYRRLIRRAIESTEYWARAAMWDFVRDLGARMDAQNMNRAALAEEIEVSPAYITKALRGEANFTIETMTKLAMAVGGRVHIRIEDRPVALVASRLEAASWNVPVAMTCGYHAESNVRHTIPANRDAAKSWQHMQRVSHERVVTFGAQVQ
jgi:transcriptional regulator with XRE-family HTH domain